MFRCELCDNYLYLFRGGRLCDCCYKIRTIVKCYDCETILKCLEKNFLVKSEEDIKKDIEKVVEEINKIEINVDDLNKVEEYKPPLTRREVKVKMREEGITWEEAVKKYGDGTQPIPLGK